MNTLSHHWLTSRMIFPTLSYFEERLSYQSFNWLCSEEVKSDKSSSPSLNISSSKILFFLDRQNLLKIANSKSFEYFRVDPYISFGPEKELFNGVHYHVLEIDRKCTFCPEFHFKLGPEASIRTVWKSTKTANWHIIIAR